MSLFSFLKRSPKTEELEGYHQRHVRTDHPIHIKAGAGVAGDVVAPTVVIDGDLYGSVYALEVVIEAQGKIWGDVFGCQLRVAPGGALNGWFNRLSETEFEAVARGDSLPDPRSSEAAAELPEAAVEFAAARDEAQLELLRKLQAEAMNAAAARLALEQRYEAQLQEEAGEAFAQVEALSAELEGSQAESARLKERLQTVESALEEAKVAVKKLQDELAGANQAASNQEPLLSAYQAEAERQRLAYEQLLKEKENVSDKLDEARQKLAAMDDRFESLEAALQASVQHGSEQQQSLVRWQELADDTQARADTMQKELEALKSQLEASEPELDILKLQTLQLEEDWKQSTEELKRRDEEISRLKSALEIAEASLAESTEELQAYYDKRKDPLAVNAAVAEARDRQRDLQERLVLEAEARTAVEAALSEAELLLEDRSEQLLWATANQQSTRAELEQVRQDARDNETLIEQLRDGLQAAEAIMEEQQAQIEQLRAEAAQRVEPGQQPDGGEALIAGLKSSEAQREALHAEVEALKKEAAAALQVKQAQLDASEAEIQQHLQELDDQGQRLAEVQATLIERELQLEEGDKKAEARLEQLRSQLKDQAEFIQRMKEVTSSHIEGLETQLAQIHQQDAAEGTKGDMGSG